MQLLFSMKCVYGIKALVYISGEKNVVSPMVIAEHEKIPLHFLKNILVELERNGFLHLKKGKEKGYKLAKPAEYINLYDVIQVLNGALVSLPCTNSNGSVKCDGCDNLDCSVRFVMTETQQEVAEILKMSTIRSMQSEKTIPVVV